MTYLGSKERLASKIVPFLNNLRQPGQLYVEPFVGSCSIFEKMSCPKIGSDAMKSLIYLWRDLMDNLFIEPASLSKEEYDALMKDPEPSSLQAYAGFFWSFSSLYNKGYSHEAYHHGKSFPEALQRAERMARQRDNGFLKLLACSFHKVDVEGALIYCDPPYKGTEPYKGAPGFSHEDFYSWCLAMKAKGNTLVISEYSMPTNLGFYEVLSFPHSTNMFTVNRNKVELEKLYML